MGNDSFAVSVRSLSLHLPPPPRPPAIELLQMRALAHASSFGLTSE